MSILTKFDGLSLRYVQYRPSYSEEAIDYVLKSWTIPITCVADVWAWTGILSKLFLERWRTVYAIDPNVEMLNQAILQFWNNKQFNPIVAKAEHMNLESNSMDLIVVWQAFHRFDLELFRTEAKRVLKESAEVAIFYNNGDYHSEIIQRIDQLSKKYCPLYQGSSGGLSNNEQIFREFFSCYNKAIFSNNYNVSLEAFLWLNFSASYAPKEWDECFEQYKNELIELFYRYAQWENLIMHNNTILRIWTL